MNNLFLSITYLVNLLICILLDINYKKNGDWGLVENIATYTVK